MAEIFVVPPSKRGYKEDAGLFLPGTTLMHFVEM